MSSSKLQLKKTDPESKVGIYVEKNKKINIAEDEFTNLISQTKKSICNAIGFGPFKFWVSAKITGSVIIFGISASSESGIEVTINCKK